MRVFNLWLLMPLLVIALDTSAQKKGGAATPVIVTVVQETEFSDEVEALGTLRANESVELTSSVTEVVTKVLFNDNQRVKKGEVLIEMDAQEELAQLAEENSFTSESKRQVKRLSPLVKEGAASASNLDEYRRELEGAQARLRAIQSRIDQRIIKAPFDGVLGLRNISVGSLAQPGAIITTIDDDSVMKLDFSVPEVYLSTLKPGVMIEAETEAYPGKIFKGKIASIDSRIDPVTRSIEARALIDNAEALLKPGLLMQVELKKNPRKALLVPEEALVSNGPDHFVFVVVEAEGKTSAARRKVEIGTRQYGVVEATSGLQEGDQVVTHGILRIRPGSALKILAVENDGDTLDSLINKGALSKAQNQEG